MDSDHETTDIGPFMDEFDKSRDNDLDATGFLNFGSLSPSLPERQPVRSSSTIALLGSRLGAIVNSRRAPSPSLTPSTGSDAGLQPSPVLEPRQSRMALPPTPRPTPKLASLSLPGQLEYPPNASSATSNASTSPPAVTASQPALPSTPVQAGAPFPIREPITPRKRSTRWKGFAQDRPLSPPYSPRMRPRRLPTARPAVKVEEAATSVARALTPPSSPLETAADLSPPTSSTAPVSSPATHAESGSEVRYLYVRQRASSRQATLKRKTMCELSEQYESGEEAEDELAYRPTKRAARGSKIKIEGSDEFEAANEDGQSDSESEHEAKAGPSKTRPKIAQTVVEESYKRRPGGQGRDPERRKQQNKIASKRKRDRKSRGEAEHQQLPYVILDVVESAGMTASPCKDAIISAIAQFAVDLEDTDYAVRDAFYRRLAMSPIETLARVGRNKDE